MIFETLNESADRRELLLRDGGLLHYHRRRDGWVTIREILVLPERRKQGVAQLLLCDLLTRESGIVGVRAKCPCDLESGNEWYRTQGFRLVEIAEARSGRLLNVWELTGENLNPCRYWSCEA